MGPNRKPMWGKGFRNVFCRYYGECLDDVIQNEWDDWDCEACGHCSNRDTAPEFGWGVKHSIAYYEVMT